MESLLREAIERIHASGTKCVIQAAGGNQGISWILGVHGASRTILDVHIPYSRPAFREAVFTKKWAGGYCSAESARELAKAAYVRGIRLSNAGDEVLGLASTAVLESGREIKGGRRAFVAAEMSWGAVVYELVFGGNSKRWVEDGVVGRLLIQALYDCVVQKVFTTRIESRMELVRNALANQDVLKQPTIHERADVLEGLIRGEVSVAEYYKRNFEVNATRGNLFLSGSFNPLHIGHQELLQTAAQIRGTDAKPCYELSAVNVDKPPLSRNELLKRLAQFHNTSYPIVITSEPLFHAKAALFPGSSFVIGYDTAVRLFMAKYYNHNEQKMYNSLLSIVRNDCNFLVAGRKVKDTDGNEKYMTSSDMNIPPPFRSIFQTIPESTFRCDISSTELRERRKTFSSPGD